MTDLTLPWPCQSLSSNSRVHWAVKAKAVGRYREASKLVAIAAHIADNPEATLTFEFYPPDRRRRDAHNMPDMMKAAIDGIADAMGCDDNEFRCVFPSKFCDPVKGGKVIVRVS